MMSKEFERIIKEGDRFTLKYCGREYPYVVKNVNGIGYLIHDSETPLGVPLNAIAVDHMKDFDFTKVED